MHDPYVKFRKEGHCCGPNSCFQLKHLPQTEHAFKEVPFKGPGVVLGLKIEKYMFWRGGGEGGGPEII